jgi:hypothetical protein
MRPWRVRGPDRREGEPSLSLACDRGGLVCFSGISLTRGDEDVDSTSKPDTPSVLREAALLHRTTSKEMMPEKIVLMRPAAL